MSKPLALLDFTDSIRLGALFSFHVSLSIPLSLSLLERCGLMIFAWRVTCECHRYGAGSPVRSVPVVPGKVAPQLANMFDPQIYHSRFHVLQAV